MTGEIPARPQDYRSPWREEVDERQSGTTELYDRPDGGKIALKRKQTTLALVSGGIDSVYTMVRLLRDSSDELIVHHVHMVNAERRHEIEAAHMKRIVDYCRREYRDFHYTESTVDRRSMATFTPDIYTSAFEGGLIASSFLSSRAVPVDRWTTGVCWEERAEELTYPRFEERYEHFFKIMKAATFPNKTPRYFELPIVTKLEECRYLGKELSELCWTCSLPQHRPDGSVHECGRCKKCRIMEEIRQDLGIRAPTEVERFVFRPPAGRRP